MSQRVTSRRFSAVFGYAVAEHAFSILLRAANDACWAMGCRRQACAPSIGKQHREDGIGSFGGPSPDERCGSAFFLTLYVACLARRKKISFRGRELRSRQAARLVLVMPACLARTTFRVLSWFTHHTILLDGGWKIFVRRRPRTRCMPVLPWLLCSQTLRHLAVAANTRHLFVIAGLNSTWVWWILVDQGSAVTCTVPVLLT